MRHREQGHRREARDLLRFRSRERQVGETGQRRVHVTDALARVSRRGGHPQIEPRVSQHQTNRLDASEPCCSYDCDVRHPVPLDPRRFRV